MDARRPLQPGGALVAAGVPGDCRADPAIAVSRSAPRCPVRARQRKPWGWPWYPWTVFLVMGLGVCGRSYYLCVSMHQVGGTATIFAPYFVVPFLLAGNVLLLEIWGTARSAAILRIAFGAPVGLLLLAAIPPSGKLGLSFLHDTFIGTIGVSPLLITVWAISAFYGWAALRRSAVCPGSALRRLANPVGRGAPDCRHGDLVGPARAPDPRGWCPPGAIAAGRRERVAMAGGVVLRSAGRDAGLPRDQFLGVSGSDPGAPRARRPAADRCPIPRSGCPDSATRRGRADLGRGSRLTGNNS